MSVEPQNIIRLITSQLKFDYISKSNESGYKLIVKDGISLFLRISTHHIVLSTWLQRNADKLSENTQNFAVTFLVSRDDIHNGQNSSPSLSNVKIEETQLK